MRPHQLQQSHPILRPRFRFLFLCDPAGRALRLKFIPEEFAFASFARLQRQRLAFRRYDAFDFSKIREKWFVVHRE
jgi:hypothetical protein